MKVVRTITELRRERQLLGSIGLVPTMGAFHAGHLELMRRATLESDAVVVSLFVNPTQFGSSEDLSTYPRREDRDAELAAAAGVDVLFCPTEPEMYPYRSTIVHPTGAADRWEGERRPGHFDGVATVVLKLFNLVQPKKAFFGLKDLQQCAVIAQMVRDLDVPVELSFVETVRESTGLALSSRNVFLSLQEREIAPRLHECLFACARSLGIIAPDRVDLWDQQIQLRVSWLEDHGFDVEYFVAVDMQSMEPTTTMGQGVRLMAAARLGSVRLIDNVQV